MDTDTKELLNFTFEVFIVELHYNHHRDEKKDYCRRQTRTVLHPDELLCIIYDGMHKEKTKLPRFSRNPCKDLESFPRIPCNLLGFICHRQG